MNFAKFLRTYFEEHLRTVTSESLMEIFLKNVSSKKFLTTFVNKAPSWMFDRVLNLFIEFLEKHLTVFRKPFTFQCEPTSSERILLKDLQLFMRTWFYWYENDITNYPNGAATSSYF